jgi:demethoxyubiquinone hydroxylase (CLK1/Coq7/Cat5 family)
MAHDFGAAKLPEVVKKTMTLSSKVMTKAAYHL